MNTRELAKLACDALADKKAGDVKVKIGRAHV